MTERISASIGLLLENSLANDYRFLSGGLVLVTKRGSGLLSLIAGHLEKETGADGVERELQEETGLLASQVRIRQRPSVHIIPSEAKTSIGILYSGKTVTTIPSNGYAHTSEEISWVKPYSVDELIELIASPEKLYKPVFNVSFISSALLNFIGTKYAFDDEALHIEVARSWGISDACIDTYL